MDRLATRTDGLNRQESHEYDPAGNLTQFTDRKNQQSTFSYDALNRRTNSAFADGSSKNEENGEENGVSVDSRS